MSARGDGGGAGASAPNAAAATPAPGVETLAEAIERVWGHRRAWPPRTQQQRESRNRDNWASVWVIVQDVSQPVATRGTGEREGLLLF
jgi:hypothetical protein